MQVRLREATGWRSQLRVQGPRPDVLSGPPADMSRDSRQRLHTASKREAAGPRGPLGLNLAREAGSRGGAGLGGEGVGGAGQHSTRSHAQGLHPKGALRAVSPDKFRPRGGVRPRVPRRRGPAGTGE